MAENDSKAAPIEHVVDALDTSDEVDRKLTQAIGICAAVGLAVDHAEMIPEEGLRNALWGAQDLIREALQAHYAVLQAWRDASNAGAPSPT